MPDLERALHDLAGPASPIDITAVSQRADRIRRRRHGAVGGALAASALIAGLFFASIWHRGDEQSVVVAPPETTEATGTTLRPETNEPSAEQGPAITCPAPRLAPTYLPWTGELTGPPEPDRIDEVESGLRLRSLYLDDPLDDDFFSAMAVGVSTYPTLDALPLGPREATSIGELRGHEAYLVWVGDPTVGAVFIAWDEEDGSACSVYRVEFPGTGGIADHLGVSVLEDPNPATPIQQELIKVVESLRILESGNR